MKVLCCLFLFSLSASACELESWPHSRELAKAEIINELKQMPRDQVVRIALTELGNAEIKKPVDVPLLHFLYDTETQYDWRGFFAGMMYLSYGRSPAELLKRWPKKTKRSSQLTEEKICALYEEVSKASIRGSSGN